MKTWDSPIDQAEYLPWRKAKRKREGGKVNEMLKISWDNGGTCSYSLQWLLSMPYHVYVGSYRKNAATKILDLVVWRE